MVWVTIMKIIVEVIILIQFNEFTSWEAQVH